MLKRILAAGALLAMTSPASAQNSASVPDDPARLQVMMFEVGLRNALESGVQKLADRVARLYPGLSVSLEGSPEVQGFVQRQLNLYVFNVQVPSIFETSLQILGMMPPAPASRPGPDPQRVATGGGRVSAAGGLTDPDIMTVSPVVGARDPRAEYRAQVRAALIDAMLDNSVALPLGPNDTLMVVAASTGAATGVGPLYRSKQLILTIKSSDLADFRSGKITRDEAKQRITETQF